ncbi:hypothetical protein VPH35_060258 [Triticum aestivum]|uniref:Uncharacterized protein n=1 Tax=Aegilops tauschii subsp. strangulata TaxID=200361 RepID=A0A453F7B3_AEGTS
MIASLKESRAVSSRRGVCHYLPVILSRARLVASIRIPLLRLLGSTGRTRSHPSPCLQWMEPAAPAAPLLRSLGSTGWTRSHPDGTGCSSLRLDCGMDWWSRCGLVSLSLDRVFVLTEPLNGLPARPRPNAPQASVLAREAATHRTAGCS